MRLKVKSWIGAQIHKPRPRRLIVAGIKVCILSAAVAVAARAYSAWQARGQIYSFDSVPARPVAIIFGAEVYSDGTPSPMLADRVAAGAKLYREGKVKALLLTGDNHISSYNEPEAMRQYALQLGVPYTAIVLD